MQPTFEQQVNRIEEIVRALEQGNAPLDHALGLFEEGTKLVRVCSERLENAERKITLLMQGTDGTPVETPFQAT